MTGLPIEPGTGRRAVVFSVVAWVAVVVGAVLVWKGLGWLTTHGSGLW